MTLKPNEIVPDLILPLVDGGQFTLSEQQPDNFTMVVFYRGLHCPICSTYIADLDKKLAEFQEKGMTAVAVSTDDAERAAQSKKDWGITNLPLAYDMTVKNGRKWGLYASQSIKAEEPDLFLEPGLFLIRPDRTLYAGSVQTMPFARPHWEDVLGAISFVLKNDYPARGDA